MFKKLFLFLLVSIVCNARANDIRNIGVPYVQNYAKTLYMAGNQNWSVARDNRGMMYFGNAEGLLSFDGRYWQLHKMPDRQIVRAVACDKDNNIYVGGFGELGFWNYKEGRLQYNSLTGKLPIDLVPKDEIWKIYTDSQRVIFQSFSTIYIYQDGRFNTIKADGSYLFLHKVGKRFFVETIGKGLYELKDNRLEFLEGSAVCTQTGVLSMLPFGESSILIGSAKDGLFIYDGKSFTQWQTPAGSFLKTYQLNNGALIQGKYYAFGTILNGLIILDTEGNIVQRINKTSGLQNNTVLSMYVDPDQNLWAGLDNGIDRIELNSPLNFYFDKAGLFGTIYTSVIYDNKIYIGTNQGLFCSEWVAGKNFTPFNFRFIPNSQGQVWDLSIIDGQLLCGHNSGTFRVSGERIQRISSENGGWTIRKMRSNPGILVQGTYTGLAVYKRNAGGLWNFTNKSEGFVVPSRYIEEDTQHGGIWVSHAYKGLYKVFFSEDYSKVTTVHNYDEKDGLPSSYNVSIFNLENRIVFASEKGFYVHDPISNKFSAYTQLNKRLGSFASSNRIISAGNKKYWFINAGKIALADFGKPGEMNIDSGRFNILNNRMVQYYENISRINNSEYLISVDDGFVIYNSDVKGSAPKKLTPVLIRRIENITGKYTLLAENGSADREVKISYNQNNIRIAYALPYYRQAEIQYQYYLEGYSSQWSEWSNATQKDFTNLSPGSYVFKVKARINEQQVSDISEFEFEVLPPWYANTVAKIIYLLLILAGLFYLKQFYQRKLKTDQEKIALKLQQEQEEYLKQESINNEKRIATLETEKLQAELAGKKRELANSAMSLVYKNELLQKLSNEIANLKDDTGKKLSEEQLRKIHKVINEGMDDNRDWNLFESSFNEAHESFFKKLKANHLDLVPNDLKLCAYLRMNMSSKEMASLLNISLRGVEIRRYRLRKKLDVPHDKNLVEFLMEL